jgi:hypothetical protein
MIMSQSHYGGGSNSCRLRGWPSCTQQANINTERQGHPISAALHTTAVHAVVSTDAKMSENASPICFICTIVPPYPLVQVAILKKQTVHKFQNARQARTGWNMVNPISPNALCTWLIFLCPRTQAKISESLTFIPTREKLHCKCTMQCTVHFIITSFNVGNVLLCVIYQSNFTVFMFVTRISRYTRI